jgi:hypothetical protein
MDNHKLVMISIFFFVFLKHEKDVLFFVFNKNILGKLLVFGRMHENKIFFIFLKEEINLKSFEIFSICFAIFLETFRRKSSILILNLYLTL